MFNIPADVFRGRAFWIVTAVLSIEIALFYTVPTAEFIPNPPALQVFGRNFDGWRMTREFDIDEETRQFLRADDTLSRSYVDSSGKPLTLFVAFFKSQRGGVTPHSPK